MNSSTRVYLLFAALIALLATLSFTLYRIDIVRNRSELAAEGNMLVDMAGRSLHRDLIGVDSDLQYLANQALSRRMLQLHKPYLRKEVSEDYQAFMRGQGYYSQLQLVDTKGREVIRVKRNGSRFDIAAKSELLNLGNSTLFRYGQNLQKGETYESLFVPGAAQGAMGGSLGSQLRFVTPVSDSKGGTLGFIFLSYDGSALLNRLKLLLNDKNYSLWLLNKDGQYMLGPKRTWEWWGFTHAGKKNTLVKADPGLWSALSDTPVGQSLIKGYYYTHKLMCGDLACLDARDKAGVIVLPFTAGDMPWVVVSKVLNSGGAFERGFKDRWLWVNVIVILLVAIAYVSGHSTWRLALTVANLRKRESDLKEARSLLQGFIDHNPSPCYVKDEKRCYVYANQAMASALNVKLPELIGQCDDTLPVKEWTADVRNEEDSVFSYQTPREGEEAWRIDSESERHYIVNRFPLLGPGATVRAVGMVATDVTDAQIARQELAKREVMFRTLLDSAPDCIVIVNSNGYITLANSRTEDVFGYSTQELIGTTVEELVPMVARSAHRLMREEFSKSEALRPARLVSGQRKNGEIFPCEITISTVDSLGERLAMAVVRDVSNKVALERQLRQAQKMEALGNLTGGMAHDFNNLLGVIIGNLDLMRLAVGDDDKLVVRIDAALKAALSGADLTRRMLLYARRQVLEPVALESSSVLADIGALLERTLKTDVELVLEVQQGLPRIMVDQGGLETVLLNLAINARDAMPDGGQLLVEASRAYLDGSNIENDDEEIRPGNYVLISVTDTGVGISAENMTHVFEPFFTTKGTGKGTGLGLAMAYGFARQSNGHIKLYSEVGKGTSVKLYLPVADEQSVQGSGSIDEPILPHGNERVLVVDDDQAVLEVTLTYLEELGYRVEGVMNADAAIEKLATDMGFNLVVSDIVMSGAIDGIALMHRVRERFPQVKVVLASGFSEMAVATRFGELGVPFLPKPFRQLDLALAVRKALDG